MGQATVPAVAGLRLDKGELWRYGRSKWAEEGKEVHRWWDGTGHFEGLRGPR